MIRILHISDLHFGPPYVPKVGEALLKLAPQLGMNVIVASGDFTQRATREQFKAARDWLDRLPNCPLVVTPGNHDVPLYKVRKRLTDPHALYQEYISPKLNEVHRLPGMTIVSLDSTSPRRAIVNGRLSRKQLQFAEDAFAKSPENDCRIVVAHHHFAPAPDYELSEAMPQAKRSLDRFTRLKVDLVLGGHLHRAYIGNSLDVYPGQDPDHGIIIVQSGTSTSRRGRAREREKNSLNVIDLDDQTVQITTWMYFDANETFERVGCHLFPRATSSFFPANHSLQTLRGE